MAEEEVWVQHAHLIQKVGQERKLYVVIKYGNVPGAQCPKSASLLGQGNINTSLMASRQRLPGIYL